MKCVKILILMVMMSGIYTVGAAQGLGAAQELNVLPKPCSVRITDTDGRFQIHRGAGVYAENADAMLAAEYLQNYCSEYLGLPLRIVKSRYPHSYRRLRRQGARWAILPRRDERWRDHHGRKAKSRGVFPWCDHARSDAPHTRWRHSPVAAGGDYRLSTVWLSWYASRCGAPLLPGVVCEEIYRLDCAP